VSNEVETFGTRKSCPTLNRILPERMRNWKEILCQNCRCPRRDSKPPPPVSCEVHFTVTNTSFFLCALFDYAVSDSDNIIHMTISK
jgi:hypothetical protein